MATILYDYWRSSASYRLRIALGLIGEPFEVVPVNLLTGEHRAPAHLARQPQGLVPAIEIDGQVMAQSLAVIEYLDETRQPGFLPRTPVERARVRAISHAFAMDIHPVCNFSVARHAADQSGGNIEMKSWMHAFIPDRLRAVETMLATTASGRFACGDTVTMADLCLLPQVYNARRWEVPLEAMYRIREICAQLEKLPEVVAAHPDKFKPQE